MNPNRSFAEILSDKLSRISNKAHSPHFSEKTFHTTAPYHSVEDSFFFDQPPKKWNFSNQRIEDYQRMAKDSFREVTTPPSEPVNRETIVPEIPISFRCTDLKGSAKGALEHLRNLGAVCLYRESIDEKCVKQAFRKLCKQLHPDQCPSGTKKGLDFIPMRESYQTLLALFKQSSES